MTNAANGHSVPEFPSHAAITAFLPLQDAALNAHDALSQIEGALELLRRQLVNDKFHCAQLVELVQMTCLHHAKQLHDNVVRFQDGQQ